MKAYLLVAIVVLAAGSGCAAREELIAKSAAVPAGVDLSGQWRLRDNRTEAEKRSAAEQQRKAGGEDILRISRHVGEHSGRRPKTRSSGGTSVRVFLEVGESLKVTQTTEGLFISFDRSVVEEYRFGEKREINVGPVLADRVSGWEGDSYVIETLDDEGAKLVETYRLSEDGLRLRRTIAIVHKESEQLAIEQVFDRV